MAGLYAHCTAGNADAVSVAVNHIIGLHQGEPSIEQPPRRQCSENQIGLDARGCYQLRIL